MVRQGYPLRFLLCMNPLHFISGEKLLSRTLCPKTIRTQILTRQIHVLFLEETDPLHIRLFGRWGYRKILPSCLTD
jgi:hypothetical protein